MKNTIFIIAIFTISLIQNAYSTNMNFDSNLSYYENLEAFYNQTSVPAKKSLFEYENGKSKVECVLVEKKKQNTFIKGSFILVKNPTKSSPTTQGGPLFKKITEPSLAKYLLNLEFWKSKLVKNKVIGDDFVISANNDLSKAFLRATDDYVFFRVIAKYSTNRISQEGYGYCWKL